MVDPSPGSVIAIPTEDGVTKSTRRSTRGKRPKVKPPVNHTHADVPDSSATGPYEREVDKNAKTDVSTGSAAATKSTLHRKPLNFAPPARHSGNDTLQIAQKKPPLELKEAANREGRNKESGENQNANASVESGPIRSRPKRRRKVPETAPGLDSVSTDGSTTKSSTHALFASVKDPFPATDTGAIPSTESLPKSSHIDNSQIQAKAPSSESNSRKGLPNLSGENERNSRNDEKNLPKKGGPGGRQQRARRAQLPSLMFANNTMTRGPHGRLVVSTSVEPADKDPIARPSKSMQAEQQTPEVTSLKEPLASEIVSHVPDETAVQSVSIQSIHMVSANETGREGKKPRRPYFEEHVSREDALAGLKLGKYFQGPLRINQKARKEAWVSVNSKAIEDGDLLVLGERHRNRALNGDEVVLAIVTDDSDLAEEGIVSKHPDRTKAKVVHILSQRPLQRISGFLRPPGYVYGAAEQDERKIIHNVEGKSSCMFYPQDSRIPWLVIPRSNLPKELQGRNWIFDILQKQKIIFAARIVSWQSHSRMPRGTIVEELGAVGNIHAETAAILADCDVDIRDHPISALQCLPVTPWKISDEELSKRRDFRKDRICTIDPETARDLDDALSVKQLSDGIYEIGVHIADVSHFVEQDNPLDKIARDRATTVYMVQKAIPMLPRLLCEELCSLNPAVDRLAFSVTWTMNVDGVEVGPRWYGRSVIRSAVRFAYGEAQNLLDGQSWADGVGKSIDGGHTAEQITNDIKVLHRMSKAMRAKRFENGALTINAFKLNFRLDKDGLPGVAEVYQLKDANRLIEEFMLKANISVAERIVDSFPEHALLRMHPPPKDRPLREFVNYAEKLGIHIDATSSATMQDGFNKLAEMAKDNPMVSVLQNNAVRSMRRAEYMCTGLHEDQESWAHYALAVPLYTHFTSPIRRYADVVVHRLLDRALKSSAADFDAEECEAWAKNCNVRKENARTAQDRSSMLYLCAYIEEYCRKNNLCGTDEGMEVDAIIVTVRDRSVDVIVPSMALEKRIFYDDSYAVESFVHDEDNEQTEISWRTLERRRQAIQAEEGKKDLGKVAEGNAVENYDIGDQITSLSLEDGERVNKTTSLDGPIHFTQTFAALDKIKIWLRGDFSISPCEIQAGFILPHRPA